MIVDNIRAECYFDGVGSTFASQLATVMSWCAFGDSKINEGVDNDHRCCLEPIVLNMNLDTMNSFMFLLLWGCVYIYIIHRIPSPPGAKEVQRQYFGV